MMAFLRKKQEDCVPQKEPMHRPLYTAADAWALRACRDGSATPEQQKRAIDYIIRNICETYDLAYRPGSKRDTDFALGRQKVGQDIVWLLQSAPTNVNPDKVSMRKLGEQHGKEQITE